MADPVPSMKKRKALNKRQMLDIRGGRMQQTSMIMNRIEKYALGILTKKEKGEDGKMVEVPDTMTMGELRAAETYLKKILPDLSMVQQAPENPNQVKSIEEMEEELRMIAENSPLIGKLLGLPTVVNE